MVWGVAGVRPSNVVLLCMPCFPTGILALMFLGRQGVTGTSSPSAWALLRDLVHLRVLTSYDPLERWCARALMVLFVIVSVSLLVSKIRQRRLEHGDSFLLVVIAFTVIYFIAPDAMAGGGVLSSRLSLYPFLALILWFGGQSLAARWEWRLALYASGIAVMLLGLHTMHYKVLNSYLEEYLSGMRLIAPNSTLLSLAFSHDTGQIVSGAPSPFLHASGYIAAHRNIVALSTYQPTTGYFPIVFRPHLTPPLHIARVDAIRNDAPLQAGSMAIEAQPPHVDFLTYPQRTGGQVDYVLVWDIRHQQRELDATHAIFKQLQAPYELIYTSPQRGLMQLYHWKDEKKE